MKQFRNAWRGYCETVDSFNCENPMKTSYLFAFYSFLIFTFVYFKNKRSSMSLLLAALGNLEK